ncbi:MULTISPECIES: holin [Paenibacillus]|uniref:Holin n=1 Tax=Paenibacillus albilobatus TaxID=2716884 RepID=A0A919XG61_9BACL|nr:MULTISPECIES: holin [Paenibacillus]GIO31999.1 hypothetical protein J2TS6_31400 [Paenibacillus albilobatus]
MENEVLDHVLAFASILAVFVLSMVQLVKSVVNVPKNVVPIVGLVIGFIIGAVAYPFTELGLVLRIWAGGIAGLSATGLFELAFNRRSGGTKE